MTDLKTRIARGEYEVDSREVAEAIIGKLRTIDRVRRQLVEPRAARPGGRFAAAARRRADVPMG
ncbi:MAG TPA: flagellar biosynthesis anti-sigma factor FlgM [Solirubrobacterales bacterium]|nr:flagellar biosynthesis anti-sigma factor FlgM [Solirubrobacterales bacterium]